MCLPFCLGRAEGDPCTITIKDTKPATHVPGTCQSLYNCAYAWKVLYEDEKKPPMCWWKGDLRVVCCPTIDMGHRTGPFGKLYEPSQHGIKLSNDATCYYDGILQVCCPNKPDRPLPEEKGCPALDIPDQPPNLSIAEEIAWQKCMDNQRFVQVCVAETGDKDRLKRENVCFIPKEKYRISGGEPAKENEFPFMAVLGLAEAIEMGSVHDVRWVGGGSLISDRYILTAAHVLIDTEGGQTSKWVTAAHKHRQHQRSHRCIAGF
ncbi:jg20833 [Pararge aegeria aegeria]|uniref:Jg20833 protein n=1 Tax=Pararge aegeria aegeria TaxID=348720 RepID=A0A8S4QNW0_9NEOP|nr:jg20833 [Pararge aegeria aegeria]